MRKQQQKKRLSLGIETLRSLSGISGGIITETSFTCDTWTNPDSGNSCACGDPPTRSCWYSACPGLTSCLCPP